MNKPELAELNIEISASDASEDDLDRMTRQLLWELRDMEVESAELTKGGPAPHGTKSVDPVMMGNIAIAVLPSILPKVVNFVQSWAMRGYGRSVKFKGKVGGQVIEFEGSSEDLQKLLVSLEAEHLAKEKLPTDKLEPAQTGSKLARSPKIFISYRRADTADITGRIYDRLIGHFDKSAIFKDVDSIPPGVDFKEHLEKAVGKCKIFLVVIGDKWLEVTDSMRKSRLQDSSDFVRIEIEAALNRNILVIPLLVRGASMPAEKKLPPSLQKLIYRNGIPIRPDPDFHRDMDRLIEAISNYSNKKS